jgi:hypothetical protein
MLLGTPTTFSVLSLFVGLSTVEKREKYKRKMRLCCGHVLRKLLCFQLPKRFKFENCSDYYINRDEHFGLSHFFW